MNKKTGIFLLASIGLLSSAQGANLPYLENWLTGGWSLLGDYLGEVLLLSVTLSILGKILTLPSRRGYACLCYAGIFACLGIASILLHRKVNADVVCSELDLHFVIISVAAFILGPRWSLAAIVPIVLFGACSAGARPLPEMISGLLLYLLGLSWSSLPCRNSLRTVYYLTFGAVTCLLGSIPYLFWATPDISRLLAQLISESVFMYALLSILFFDQNLELFLTGTNINFQRLRLTDNFERQDSLIRQAAEMAKLSCFLGEIKVLPESSSRQNLQVQKRMVFGDPDRPLRDLYAPDRERVYRQLRHFAQERETELSLNYRTLRDEKIRHNNLQLCRSPGNTGNDDLIFGIAQDTTRICRAEERIEDATRLLQTVLDHVPCLVCARELHGEEHYVIWNRALSDFTGISPVEALRHTPQELSYKPGFAAAAELLAQPSELDQEIVRAELQVFDREHRLRELQMSKLRLPLHGWREYLLIIALDITEIRSSQRQLNSQTQQSAKSLQLRNQYLANLSYDIRSQLNAVIGFTELLRHRELPPENAEIVTALQSAGDNLMATINEIQELSKIDSSKIALHPTPVGLSRLFNFLRVRFTPEATARQLEFSVASPDVSDFLCDEHSLQKIVISLLENAFRFTDSGFVRLEGRVTMPAKDRRHLIIAVSDSGIGIKPQEQQRIFLAFEQLGAQRGAGTGLGLTLARRLATRMGGTLTLHSHPGVGSTFTLDIPEAEAVAGIPLAITNPPAAATMDYRNLRVLLVDDLELNTLVLGSLLKALFNIDAVAVQSGNAALEYLQSHAVDLVMTDLWMPDMTGEELRRRLSVEAKNAMIPVVAVTADNEAESAFDTRLFKAILKKPVNRLTLELLFSRLFPCGSPAPKTQP